MSVGPKVRIIDVALQAGVSTATVDRVLNDRPGVREKTIDRVKEALRSLERGARRPSIVPAVSADLTLDVVLMRRANFANEVLSAEIRDVCSSRGIAARFDCPQRVDPHSLAETLRQCIKAGTDGVIFQPLEHPTVREAVADLTARGIPFVTVMSDLPDSGRVAYAGLDNRAAGRTAGQLMGRLCHRPGDVAIIWVGPFYRNHEEREIGFRSVLRSEFPALEIAEAVPGLDSPEKNYAMTTQLLKRCPDLRGLYSIGGGNRGIEKAMKESGRAEQIVFIAHNLTPLTRECLMNGVMDAVVHQDMKRLGKVSVDALVNHSLGLPVEPQPMPVEIIIRENLR